MTKQARRPSNLARKKAYALAGAMPQIVYTIFKTQKVMCDKREQRPFSAINTEKVMELNFIDSSLSTFV
jgi:hypothetical protein